MRAFECVCMFVWAENNLKICATTIKYNNENRHSANAIETASYTQTECTTISLFKMLLPELIQILMLMFLYTRVSLDLSFSANCCRHMENGCTFLVAHGKHFEFQFLNYKLSHEIKSAKGNPWQERRHRQSQTDFIILSLSLSLSCFLSLVRSPAQEKQSRNNANTQQHSGLRFSSKPKWVLCVFCGMRNINILFDSVQKNDTQQQQQRRQQRIHASRDFIKLSVCVEQREKDETDVRCYIFGIFDAIVFLFIRFWRCTTIRAKITFIKRTREVSEHLNLLMHFHGNVLFILCKYTRPKCKGTITLHTGFVDKPSHTCPSHQTIHSFHRRFHYLSYALSLAESDDVNSFARSCTPTKTN